MNEKWIALEVELSDSEALAMAQFVKRVGWQEIRVNAVHDEEAYLIREVIEKVRQTLADEGYAPR